MVRTAVRLAGFVGLVAVIGSGCVVDVEFDPIGDEVSLDGDWQIDLGDGFGGQPANASNCAAAGIATVQLLIYQESGSTPWVDSQFLFPCSQGNFATVGNVLLHDRYSTQWAAYDASGVELGRSDRLLLDVTLVDHATLATAVFAVEPPPPPPTGDLQLNISWDDVAGPDYVPGTCDSAKVMEMTYDLRTAAGDPIAADGPIPCTEQITFETLDAGEYSIFLEGLDGGVVAWMSTCDMLLIAGGGVEVFNCDVFRD